MNLIIEDKDNNFKEYLLDIIERLGNSHNSHFLDIKQYIEDHNFTAIFIKTERDDYRGEAFYDRFTVHKTKYETYDSLCWLFFHELGHLILMNSEFQCVFKIAKATYYKDKGFYSPSGHYWAMEGQHEYYSEHHDEDIEEIIVSYFATWIMGTNYDRTWWNKQKLKMTVIK